MRRRWPWAALALLVLAASGWLYVRSSLGGDITAGTAYSARVACSCRFVAGRSLEDCGKDMLAGMELITLSDDPANKTVTASVPTLGQATARYREGYGCVLEPWDG